MHCFRRRFRPVEEFQSALVSITCGLFNTSRREAMPDSANPAKLEGAILHAQSGLHERRQGVGSPPETSAQDGDKVGETTLRGSDQASFASKSEREDAELGEALNKQGDIPTRHRWSVYRPVDRDGRVELT